jgi:hypothetical protein
MMTASHSWLAGACAVALLLTPTARVAPRQRNEGVPYTLSNGSTIDLSPAWAPQQVTHIPPQGSLASSAPQLTFSEFLVFQDAEEHSRLEFALSNNPFLGRDSYWLDTHMHAQSRGEEGMLSYLFYFFFPPPQTCLAGASAKYDSTARQSAKDSGDQNAPADIRVSFDCAYAPTLSDFYSYMISPRVTFRREKGAERREGALNRFYLLPMDQREINGMTFFIFEAQGTQGISLETANHFNLPDSLQGTEPDLLWAIGAPSPFPFSRIADRKNVPLVHVAFAGLAFGANKKSDFLRILQSVHAPAN